MRQQPKAGGGLLKNIARNRTNYLFLLPFGIVFLLFTVIPVVIAICLSFTHFNVLEPPTFNGWGNFQQLFFNDDLFITALTNTCLLYTSPSPRD